ncbi:unnamed protein product [Rhizoctonia solani]|uniref:HNH nuclease domain-containing protein n=1 Tax=Rhizoctonia solani TaxID=456999 RepID=A0A8H3GYU7_9AGAM|nr:unnamed protein product [Rhizoctonia solani]
MTSNRVNPRSILSEHPSPPSPPESDDNFVPPGSPEMDDSQGSDLSPPRKRAKSTSQASVSSVRLVAGSRTPTDSKLAAGPPVCLVTCHAIAPTDCCHVVPRRSTSSELDMLEYAWGIFPNRLNLDIPQNLIYLSSDLHRAFDRYDWVLLPSFDAIMKAAVVASLRSPYTEVFAQDEHDYNFVHLKDHPVRILRDKELILPFESEFHPYTAYYPPYETFPPIRSKLHPYFVIYGASAALDKLTQRQFEDFRATIPNAGDSSSVVSKLLLCRTIVRAWKEAYNTKPRPPASVHLSTLSRTRRTTSRSTRDSLQSASQRSSHKQNQSSERQPESQDKGTAAKEGQLQECCPPSTLGSNDSPRTPEHRYDMMHALASQDHGSVGYLSDIAQWAKNVSSYLGGEIVELAESDVAR